MDADSRPDAMATHKALVRQADGQLKCVRVPTPRPEAGSVLVRLHMAGVCGTDLQMLRGLRHDPADIIGHEGIGEIVATGDGVDHLRPGELVTFNPVYPCNQDRILGHTISGLFQEQILVSESDLAQGMIEKIAGRLPSALGALIEPLASVIYAYELISQVTSYDSVAIFGAGTIGLLLAMYLQRHGDGRLYLIEPSESRLRWAVDQGCVPPAFVVPSHADPVKLIGEETAGHGVDAVFLCTPRTASLEALQMALRLVRRDGCIDLIGGFPDNGGLSELPGVRLDEIRRSNVCGQPDPGRVARVSTDDGRPVALTGHRGTSARHIQQAIALLMREGNWYGRLITQVVSLDTAADELNRYRETGRRKSNGAEWVKMAIDCRREGDFAEIPGPGYFDG